MKYNLFRKNGFKKYLLINVDSSFSMKKKTDKESIGIIKFYDEELINKVILRNINNRFKKLLELIVSTSEEGDHPDSLLLCLDEAEKFKKELINKYAKYLEKKQIEKINKKLELVSNDLKNKLIMYTMINMKQNVKEQEDDYEEEYEEEIEHHRSR